MIANLPVIFCFLLLFGAVGYDYQHADRKEQTTAVDESLGGRFLVYRNAVLAYAAENPDQNKAIDDNSLTLPPWFTVASGFHAYLQAGNSYVYYQPDGVTPSLADMGLYPSMSVTVSVGIAQAGILMSPTLGDTGIVLPAVIPNGSVVYVN
jgi:hypothetical protein